MPTTTYNLHTSKLLSLRAYTARGSVACFEWTAQLLAARTETKMTAGLAVEGMRDITVVLYLGRPATISAVSHPLLKFLAGLCPAAGWLYGGDEKGPPAVASLGRVREETTARRGTSRDKR